MHPWLAGDTIEPMTEPVMVQLVGRTNGMNPCIDSRVTDDVWARNKKPTARSAASNAARSLTIHMRAHVKIGQSCEVLGPVVRERNVDAASWSLDSDS